MPPLVAQGKLPNYGMQSHSYQKDCQAILFTPFVLFVGFVVKKLMADGFFLAGFFQIGGFDAGHGGHCVPLVQLHDGHAARRASHLADVAEAGA